MTPERFANLTKVLNNRQPDLAVVMENIVDPHNIFAVMRTCDAVGIQDIYVVNTQFKKHFKHGKSSSSGAAKWLTIHLFDNLEDCMEVVKERYGKVLAAYLSDGATPLYDIDFTGSMALAFGHERDGISKELLAMCDGSFIIPQAGMIKSLNISVACAVTLYEAKRQRLEKGFYNGEPRLVADDRHILAMKWGMED